MTLRELRKAQGLTLAALGAKVGVSYNAIHLYEIGERNPPIKKLPALAAALGVTEAEIIECFKEGKEK